MQAAKQPREDSHQSDGSSETTAPVTSPFQSRITEIYVGDNPDPFRVHIDILRAGSPFLCAALGEKRFAEGHEGILRLEEVKDPDNNFSFVVGWMYAHPRALDVDPHFGIKHVISTYMLADRLMMELLKAKLIMRLIDLFSQFNPFSTSLDLSGSMLDDVVERPTVNDTLIHLVTDYCRRYPSDRDRVIDPISNVTFVKALCKDSRVHEVSILRDFYRPSLEAIHRSFDGPLADQVFEHHPLFRFGKMSNSRSCSAFTTLETLVAPTTLGLHGRHGLYFDNAIHEFTTTDTQVEHLPRLYQKLGSVIRELKTDHLRMIPSLPSPLSATLAIFDTYFDLARCWLVELSRSRSYREFFHRDEWSWTEKDDYIGMVLLIYSYQMFLSFLWLQAKQIHAQHNETAAEEIICTSTDGVDHTKWVQLFGTAHDRFYRELICLGEQKVLTRRLLGH